MSDRPLTPEQFAWLMSLPSDHPERLAWRGRPEFESLCELYGQFEARPGAGSDRELRQAVVALEQRYHADFGAEPLAEPPGARPSAGRAHAARPWWSLFRRPAFAVAAAVIVTIGGVWLAARPRVPVDRGGSSPVILEPRRFGDDLEIRWTPVAGVESYRLSFIDDSMREVAAVEDCRGTRYLLKSSALPAGLEHGADVFLQVHPVRLGATAGAAGTRSIRVP